MIVFKVAQAANFQAGSSVQWHSSAFLGKEVLVETLEFDRAAKADADIMLDHQIREPFAVDEDHALCEVLCIIDRILAESRGRDENTFGRAEPNKAADKALLVHSRSESLQRNDLAIQRAVLGEKLLNAHRLNFQSQVIV